MASKKANEQMARPLEPELAVVLAAVVALGTGATVADIAAQVSDVLSRAIRRRVQELVSRGHLAVARPLRRWRAGPRSCMYSLAESGQA